MRFCFTFRFLHIFITGIFALYIPHQNTVCWFKCCVWILHGLPVETTLKFLKCPMWTKVSKLQSPMSHSYTLPQDALLYSDKTSCRHNTFFKLKARMQTDWCHMMSARGLWGLRNDLLRKFAPHTYLHIHPDRCPPLSNHTHIIPIQCTHWPSFSSHPIQFPPPLWPPALTSLAYIFPPLLIKLYI